MHKKFNFEDAFSGATLRGKQYAKRVNEMNRFMCIICKAKSLMKPVKAPNGDMIKAQKLCGVCADCNIKIYSKECD